MLAQLSKGTELLLSYHKIKFVMSTSSQTWSDTYTKVLSSLIKDDCPSSMMTNIHPWHNVVRNKKHQRLLSSGIHSWSMSMVMHALYKQIGCSNHTECLPWLQTIRGYEGK